MTLITLVVYCALIWFVLYLVDRHIPPPFKQVLLIVIVLIVVIVALNAIIGGGPIFIPLR